MKKMKEKKKSSKSSQNRENRKNRLPARLLAAAVCAGIFAALCAGVWNLGVLDNWIPMVKSTETGAVPQVSAAQAILVDGRTGKVLYEKNSGEKAYPASTTKIMTALLMLETLEENDSPIEQEIAVPREAVGTEGSSLYLKENEKITIEDLLYGLMLCSGNDAAVTAAYIAGGDVETFVERMNAKAGELHCSNTHFVNPNGLFDENHYTTVKDMAIIARAAMEHPKFREIVGAQSWQAHRKENEFNYFYNKNKTVHQFKGGNGIKIGFTKASGRTLVASSARDGKEMICVVMGAPDWFNDAYRLMEYGYKRMEE